MTWLASFAKTLSRRLATASRGFTQSRQSRGISGPAPITRQTQTPSLPPQSEPLLLRRAIRLCNREPKAIARYMQKHQNLHRGR